MIALWLACAAPAPTWSAPPEPVEEAPVAARGPWWVRGPDGVPTERVMTVEDRFALEDPPAPTLTGDRGSLGRVAADAARWLRAHPDDPAASGSLLEWGPRSPEALLGTLDHVATGSWSLDDFQAWRWTPDAEAASAAGVRDPSRIRQTRYLVYRSPGSRVRTERFDTALYAAPADPKALDRPAIYAGAYEPGGSHAGQARPLVWMRRQDVDRALMQGTVAVQLESGEEALFNVHVHNDRPYQRGLSDPGLQPRYWYFREVDGVLGYGDADKIRLAPDVAVAGDVFGLGVGTVLLLVDGGVGSVVVLADTGGAFQPNFFQLDRYTGLHTDHAAFERATAAVPRYVDAWVLVRAESAMEPR